MDPQDQSNNPEQALNEGNEGSSPHLPPLTDSLVGSLLSMGHTQPTIATWQPPSPEELQYQFPQYEIRGVLGRGGMGAVYKGWQTSLQRFVAIKVLPADIEDEGMDYAERFKQEARAMAKFKHPGIVAVYDAGETRERLLYFVMECVEGKDVARLVTERGRLPVAEALSITSRVCEAMAYAHERGVIHRDIKPSNVMIEADGTVKVADFGLAKLSSADRSVNTMSSLQIGSPDFMPPEALSGSGNVDHRGDIYAVGGMLYQMLTGKPPHGRFPPPSVAVPGLDPCFDAIVDKAMHADADKRYSSANEMLAAITRAAANHKVAGPGRRTGTKALLATIFVTVIICSAVIAFGQRKKNHTATPGSGNPETGTGEAGTQVSPSAPIRRDWIPAPSKFNAVIDRDAVHLKRFDTWGTGDIQKTNVAVRSMIAWQPNPPGRNDLIKVTARWTDKEHYYACLYGPTVEVGVYRAPIVTPLRRWLVEPPVSPDEAVPLQLACVGNHLAVWVRDRLVGVMDDDKLTGAGKIGAQAIDGHFRSLDYLDLDGLADAAAFERLGLDVTGATAIPSAEWMTVFPSLSKAPGLAEFTDGWARLLDIHKIKQLPGPNGTLLAIHNGGVRAQRRIPEGWHGSILLHARVLESGRRVNLCYYEPKIPGEKGHLQLRHFQPEELPADATAEQAWAAQKLLAEERIPAPAGEVTTELIVVGSNVRGRMGIHTITAIVEDDGKAGRMVLDEASTLAFRDVKVMNLDTMPNTEALKFSGMTTIQEQNATPPPSRSAGWRDALTESPLSEVIAKAEHTEQGYRLPENNHWEISPQRLRSGALRVRATATGDKFLSIYIVHENRDCERIRFLLRNSEWLLTSGTLAKQESDFAAKAASSPIDGMPHELTFARIGGRLRVLVDGQSVFNETEPNATPGKFVLDIYDDSQISVESVEYLELDDVPESDALKLVGLDAGGKKLPAATGASSAPATDGAPKAETWLDLMRPEAAAMLRLEGGEKPGPEGLVIPDNGKVTVAAADGTGSTDGALRFRARFEPVTKSRFHIRARSTAGTGYGLLVINRAKVVLQVWRGNQTVDTLKVFELSEPLEEGQEYEMEMRAVGSTLTARLNGKKLGEVEDNTHPRGAFQVRGAQGRPSTILGLEYLDLSASRSSGAGAAVRPLKSDR